jgi:hypothetical protein
MPTMVIATVTMNSQTKIIISALLILAGTGMQSIAAPDERGAGLQGKLLVQKGKASLADPGGMEVQLVSGDDSISETLADGRLSGREVKVIGRLRPDGSFDVREFYVVRGKTLCRLIYFCDVCHITTFRPGDCLCCQKPTVPTEVPLTDPRVYHEDIKPLQPK